MNKHYPIALDLINKSVLVVGGGSVAERKVKSLLQAGANVTVVSPKLTSKLQELVDSDLISCEKRNYQTTDIENKFLVIGATDISAVNRKVAEDGSARNLLINIVDQPELSNFNVTAAVRRGALCLSVSTDGKSPALSRKIRKELQEKYGSEYGEFLELMGQLRKEVIEKIAKEEKRKQIFRELAYSEAINYMKNEDYKQAEEIINGILPDEIMVELVD